MEFTLKDLLDIPKLNNLLDSLDRMYCLPSAVIDTEGNILTATDWQDICTKFHRVNPVTEKMCIESDRHVGKKLKDNASHVIFRCPMGLVDSATPIIIEGKHLGNIFTGQLFIDPPDEALFIEQARQFGFDENEYLEAIRKVPHFTEEQLHKNLTFIHSLAQMLAEQGLQAIRERNALKALQQSEEFVKRIIASSNDCIKVLDIEGHLLSISEGGQKLLEIDDLLPFLGLSWIDFWKEDIEGAQEVIRKAGSGEVGIFHGYCPTVKGTPKWWEVVVTPMMNDDNKIENLLAVSRDITERKRASESLEISELKYRDLFNNAEIGMFRSKLDGSETLDVNQKFLDIIGRTREETIGKPSLVLWADLKEREEMVRKLTEDGRVTEFEFKMLNPMGEIRDCLTSLVLYLDDGILEGSIIDITKRKQTEEALRKSEYFFKESQRSASIGSYHADFVASKWESSETLDIIFGIGDGYDRSIQGWLDIVHPDDRDMMDRYLIEEVISNRKPFSKEYRIIRKNDGKTRWVNGRGSAEFDSDGNMLSLIGTIQDISDKKVNEEVLKESEEKFSKAFNACPALITIASMEDGRFIDVNDMMLTTTGFKKNEVIGHTSSELGFWFNADERLKYLDELNRKSSLRNHEIQYRMHNGEVRDFLVSSELIEISHKRCSLNFILDVTEKKQDEAENNSLKKQLFQAQKMESVGRLAGGVAHDFNNMLSVILGHAELGLMQLDASNPVYSDLTEIRRTAERSADLTRQLLTFARKQTVAPTVLDLNETVSGILKMLQRMIGEDIHLKWHPAENVCTVKMDSTQIDQILANLCVNARDAIKDVGTITIETENCTIDENFCISHVELLPGKYVRLTVSDDGIGMDKEILANIFEPFYTTKEFGKGTGLGLATVYGAVKQNNGYIDVYSELGTGTTFTIYLPCYQGKNAQASNDGVTKPSPKGHETILLVEDEPSILNMVTMILTKQGYNVLPANTPGIALQLAREFNADIDLLMTDVVMPEMNGRDLAKNMLSLYPNIKRLFMSGYTADVIAHHGVLDEGVHFIQKPFAMDSLATKLREVLNN